MLIYHTLDYVRVHGKKDSVDIINVLNQMTLKYWEIILEYLWGLQSNLI